MKNSFFCLCLVLCSSFISMAYAEESREKVTYEQCTAQKGIIVNATEVTYFDKGKFVTHKNGCIDGHSVGYVSGMRCPCICCVGEKMVDCQKNSFKITQICDEGLEIRYKYEYLGAEIPKEIRLDLVSDEYRTFVSGRVVGNTGTQKLVLDKESRDKNYTILESYQVKFKNSLFSNCRYDLPKIKIRPCKNVK